MKIKCGPARKDDESTLSVELWEIIINELDGDDWTLKQCALTCRLFLPLAQKHLFQHVELHFLSDSANKFLQIFKNSACICDYVKKVSLCERTVLQRFEPSATIQNAMTQILSMVNITEFELSRQYGLQIDFSGLQSSLRNEIVKKCRKVVSLTLIGVNGVPYGILEHIQGLVNLELQDVYFVQDDDSQNSHQSSSNSKTIFSSRPQHMKVSGTYVKGVTAESIYPFSKKRGNHSLDFQHLVSLTIDMDNGWLVIPPSDFHAVRWMIKCCAKSLKHLDLTVTTNRAVLLPNDEHIFDTSSMPLLANLSLTGVLWNSETNDNASPVSLSWLSRHLETIPPSRKLKAINMHCIITGSQYISEATFDSQGLQYFEELILNKVLGQTSDFTIKFTIWGYNNSFIRNILKARLPTLWEQALIEFADTDYTPIMDTR